MWREDHNEGLTGDGVAAGLRVAMRRCTAGDNGGEEDGTHASGANTGR